MHMLSVHSLHVIFVHACRMPLAEWTLDIGHKANSKHLDQCTARAGYSERRLLNHVVRGHCSVAHAIKSLAQNQKWQCFYWFVLVWFVHKWQNVVWLSYRLTDCV